MMCTPERGKTLPIAGENPTYMEEIVGEKEIGTSPPH
jgi:hypothetical protein